MEATGSTKELANEKIINEKLNVIIEKQHAMDVKLSSLCTNVHHIIKEQDVAAVRLNNLPCDTHTAIMMNEVNNRVSWRVFWGISGLLIMVILGSYKYTNVVEHDVHQHIVDTATTHADRKMEAPQRDAEITRPGEGQF